MSEWDPEQFTGLLQLHLKQQAYKIDEKIAVLEKRIVAAEETSRAATAQMTAVLAVLNVLAKYAGAPPRRAK